MMVETNLKKVITVVDEETPVVRQKPGVFVISELVGNSLHILLEQARARRPGFDHLHVVRSLRQARFILIQAKTEAWAWKALRAVKSRQEHFLKPLLLIYESEVAPLVPFADAALRSPATPEALVEALQNNAITILERLAKLPEISPSVGGQAFKKIMLLRYLYARPEGTLQPLRDHRATVGYTYPPARMLFNVEPGVESAELESLEEEQLLVTEMVDRVHVCPKCQHTQINFRELCSHCNSLNISEQTTIHHFRCAYVGKESEFLRGDNLVCPKCRRELRHIGVDYDKPSEIIWCSDCKRNFAEPRLSCFCLACANDFAPGDAVIKQIYNYKLSREGVRAAEEGALPGFGLLNILKKEVGFYKLEVFREYFDVEVSRSRRYKTASTLSLFYLDSLRENLDERMQNNSRQFRKVLSQVLKQTYRKTDMFAELTNGNLLILFLSTSTERAKIAYRRLGERLEQEFGVTVKLRYKLYDLAKVENVESLWEHLKNA